MLSILNPCGCNDPAAPGREGGPGGPGCKALNFNELQTQPNPSPRARRTPAPDELPAWEAIIRFTLHARWPIFIEILGFFGTFESAGQR